MSKIRNIEEETGKEKYSSRLIKKGATDFTNMMNTLKNLKINSWFALNSFVKALKEKNKTSFTKFSGSLKDFKKEVKSGGIAFVNFSFEVDGVTIEIFKYLKIFKEIFGNIDIHLIGGEFAEVYEESIKSNYKKFVVKGITGFLKWKLFNLFFKTKLERGEKIYNELIISFWNEVLSITERIGNYLEKNNIKLLFIVNTNSNPGNVSLALSLVLLTEYLQIPVICNNHDFYWEGGKSEIEIKYHGAKPGPRDHYFTNYHLEEFFSIFEMIYPWKTKSWFLLNINPEQSSTLIDRFGHNPANVGEICTAIDTNKFKPIKDEKRKENILKQISGILSGYKKELKSISIDKIIADEKFKLHPHPFITGFDDNIPIDFTKKNFIILQPTRIIERKCIEIDFIFLKKLLEKRKIRKFFEKEKYDNIIIIVTGPIVIGHYEYFYKILALFKIMLYGIDLEYRNKIFLAFLLSEIDKPLFIKRYNNPIKIHDIFSIASLITLPSETEGRGLPIIEAASCEVPIITRRYYPEEVYSKVVGEDLPEKDRFKVFEFRNNELDDKFIIDLVQSLGKDRCEFMKHNRMVVKKRYSFELLKNDLEKALYKLYLNLKHD